MHSTIGYFQSKSNNWLLSKQLLEVMIKLLFYSPDWRASRGEGGGEGVRKDMQGGKKKQQQLILQGGEGKRGRKVVSREVEKRRKGARRNEQGQAKWHVLWTEGGEQIRGAGSIQQDKKGGVVVVVVMLVVGKERA